MSMRIQELKDNMLRNERQKAFYKRRLARFIQKDIYDTGIELGLSNYDALMLAEIFQQKTVIHPFMYMDKIEETIFSKN